MAKKDKKLWIDMCAGSELKDTQGETLSVDGADISDLEAGKGRFNDNHGKGFFNSLGRVTEAKKIFKSDDCDNERHSYYWDKIKAPFVYCKGYLYSDEDHSNAKAAAAILRNIHREDAPLAMKASVEGGVLSRGISDPTRLARTKIHSVALTFTPANNATLVEPVDLDKSHVDWDADKRLIKSVMHLAETNIPSFRHIERHASAHTIHENILKIQELSKTLGIEIEIKNSNPEEIMQHAVLSKVASSVYRMNKLVKAINAKNYKVEPGITSEPTLTSPGKVKMVNEQKTAGKLKAQDEYQQGISRLKSDSTTPKRPQGLNDTPSGTSKVLSAKKVQATNTFKIHASKAMKDPEHLNSMHKELTDKGIHPDKVKTIVDKVKSHMVKSDDDMEKGDIGRAAKNLVIAGAMATGVSSMTPDSPKKADTNRTPAAKIQEAKPKSTKFKGKDADYYNDLDDTQKARAEKTKDKYSKLKKGLFKALTAGYGGAGAPGNLSGGGVMQSEALDDGRGKDKGMSYIICENCGHEQVHMQHQVKCRECRKNFSLDKLEGHL